jgi:hypothetical protein
MMAAEPLINSEPAEALARAQQLLREGKRPEACPWLQAACANAQALPAEQAAAAWCLLGLEQREQGEEGPAGHSFLRALQYQGDCEQALWALDFHRYSPELLAELLPGLDAMVRQGQCQHPRALEVLADWHHQVGDRPMAERFFRALAGEPGDGPASERRPEALVIGAPKCGTTSLMAYLGAHPQVWTQPRKELHFFDNRWHWGPQWYAEQFPARRPGGPFVRLEGTPDYLQHRVIAERVRLTLPEVSLIVVLREPVARALSWYHHQRRWGGLTGSAEEVIARELEGINALPAAERLALGWRAPNCLAGSLYDEQLMSWKQHFSSKKLLLLRFEDLSRNPGQATRRALAFLGLDPDDLPAQTTFPVLNRASEPYPPLDPGLAQLCRQTLLAGAHQLWGRL